MTRSSRARAVPIAWLFGLILCKIADATPAHVLQHKLQPPLTDREGDKDNADNEFEPPTDCITEACVFEDTVRIPPGDDLEVKLSSLNPKDSLHMELRYMDCPDSTVCDGLQILILDLDQFRNFIHGRKFETLPGSWDYTNSTMTYQENIQFEVFLPAVYLVLNMPDQTILPVTVFYSFSYKRISCLESIFAVYAIPLVVCLLMYLCFCCHRRKRIKEAKRQRALTNHQHSRSRETAASSSTDDEDDDDEYADDHDTRSYLAKCCIVNDSRFKPNPMTRLGCRIPSKIASFAANMLCYPQVSFKRWAASIIIFSYAWNPPMADDMRHRVHRLQFVSVRLFMSLLFCTVWRGAVDQFNQSINSIVNENTSSQLGEYFTAYVGVSLLQDVATALLKPVFVFALYTSRSWRATQDWRRWAGWVCGYTLDIVLMLLVAAICYYLYILQSEYRCTTLFQGVLIPWLIYVFARELFVCSIIPLPAWYWLMLKFGGAVEEADEIGEGNDGYVNERGTSYQALS